MLAEPDRTPYDVNFRLLGFRVRIHPLFWLGTVLLGANTLNAGLEYLAIWVAVVLISITVHELGHAIAFRRFGSDSHIVLWMFGGLAVPYSRVAGRNQRILVSLAGPFAGFLLCGLVYGSNYAIGWGSIRNGAPVAWFYTALVLVNLYWGILNLLPVYPLDGGQVSRELCEGKWRNRGRGVIVSLKISIGVAIAVAVYSIICEMDYRSRDSVLDFLPWWFPRGSLYTGLLFGLLAYQSYQLLQFHSRGYYYEAPDDRVSWEK
ncbi:MAG: hypothetical protein C0467_11840 [Planctomycetaceae bacterium]|nr:hypothetical protein [Planctomycetaceae bacterium]